MADVCSTTNSDRYPDNDGTGSDFDSTHLKSPRSETDSGSFDVDSYESQGQASLPISRPLSRSSVTSGLSVTATKDGIEGKRVKRTGIPGYPLNLINKMYSNYAKQHQLQVEDGKENQEDPDEFSSIQSIKSATSLIPQYDPSDRDNDRGSLLSSEYYEEQDMEVPKDFDPKFNGTPATRAGGGVPQINLESETDSYSRN